MPQMHTFNLLTAVIQGRHKVAGLYTGTAHGLFFVVYDSWDLQINLITGIASIMPPVSVTVECR